MSTVYQMAELMGGNKVLKTKVSSSSDLIALTHRGLPFQALESIEKKLQMNPSELIRILNVSKKTLDRHRTAGRLSDKESDRLMRLVRIATRAQEVFGSIKKASDWLHHENHSLGGKKPLALLETDIGTSEVFDILGRIEYGVFS